MRSSCFAERMTDPQSGRMGAGTNMITSSANARVKQVIQWQTKAKERKSAGIFLTEGLKMFEEMPEERAREVFVSEEAAERFLRQPDIADKLLRTGYELVSEEVFQKMSDTQTPQGILCVVERPRYSLEQLLNAETPLLVALENLQDPGNLGTIVRTGEGAGITGIIMNRGTVDIYNPKTIRATMGSVYRVPFVCVEDLRESVKAMRERGIRCYAAHLSGRKHYDDCSFREGTAFLIGNEGNGLTSELADMADEYLKIPMEGQVESLNAGIATALLMYEAHRQRHRA